MSPQTKKELNELRGLVIDLRLALQDCYPELRKARMRTKSRAPVGERGELVFGAPVRGIVTR